MTKGTMTKRDFNAAAFSPKGEPLANGPKCATCGDLAVWGSHPACERHLGKLLLWIPNPAASALGRLAAGKPKAFSPEDRARRAELARGLAARTKAKAARICACGKPVGAGVGDGICIDCRFAGK
jgi:hypothetical protein